jgi:hypothetical protein
MKLNCNKNLLDVLKLTEEMDALAQKGFTHSKDDNCIILYGIIRDSAYKIKTSVEKEINQHKNLNKWE